MATVCDVCGHRTNEVKSGGGIEAQGVKIEVDVHNKEDLCRDLLKVSIYLADKTKINVYFVVGNLSFEYSRI